MECNAIGVKDGTRPNACIVNTVMQISKATPADAPLVALAMSKQNYSCQCIEKRGFSPFQSCRRTPLQQSSGPWGSSPAGTRISWRMCATRC